MKRRNLGFIGLGAMGGGMVQSLLRADFPVTGYDPLPEARARAVNFGAKESASPAAVAAQAEVILASLPDPAALEQAVFGEDGLLNGIQAGATFIDLSTVDPESSRRVGAALAEKGARMLDVPVGKGPLVAAKGELTLMVGGDPAVVADCQDILGTLGAAQFYCGPLGNGAATKLINNLVSCSILALNAEALVLGAKAGVNADVLVEVMSNTAAGNFHLDKGGVTRILSGEYGPNFKLALAEKDLRLAVGMGTQLKASLPIGQASLFVHSLGLSLGLGEEDQAACVKVLEQVGGARVRPA